MVKCALFETAHFFFHQQFFYMISAGYLPSFLSFFLVELVELINICWCAAISQFNRKCLVGLRLGVIPEHLCVLSDSWYDGITKFYWLTLATLNIFFDWGQILYLCLVLSNHKTLWPNTFGLYFWTTVNWIWACKY